MSYSGAVRLIGSCLLGEGFPGFFGSNSGAFVDAASANSNFTVTTDRDIEVGDVFAATTQNIGPGVQYNSVERTGTRTIVIHRVTIGGGGSGLSVNLCWSRVFS